MSHYFENDKNLKSEIKELSYKYGSLPFLFYSDNGVFSKHAIDYGSKLLLETYLSLDNEPKKVLDVGCGYGYIGIVIGVINNSEVDMIDVNKRAVHLTEKNIKRYRDFKGSAFLSDAYENVSSKYDVIITNPPIRVGKNKVLEILEGALSIKKILESINTVELINRDKGYYVFRIKKNN